MRLLKLEILNLASLDNPKGETINFEEGVLKDCTIFSIVGSTGSGKSTILDAICLALYARTPRYPRQNNERGGKIAGRGSWCYTNLGARLEWALINFFISEHLADGYEFILPPH